MLTKLPSMHFLILLLLVGSFIYTSCSGDDSNQIPTEKLSAYCIRECVLETGDSSLCDTRCDCASKVLSEKLSKDEFSQLVSTVTGKGLQELTQNENVKEFKVAIKRCKSAKF